MTLNVPAPSSFGRAPLPAPPKGPEASPELRAKVEAERRAQVFNNCVALHRADPSKVGVIGSPSFNACLEAGARLAFRPGGATPEEAMEAQAAAVNKGSVAWVLGAVALIAVSAYFAFFAQDEKT